MKYVITNILPCEVVANCSLVLTVAMLEVSVVESILKYLQCSTLSVMNSMQLVITYLYP